MCGVGLVLGCQTFGPRKENISFPRLTPNANMTLGSIVRAIDILDIHLRVCRFNPSRHQEFIPTAWWLRNCPLRSLGKHTQVMPTWHFSQKMSRWCFLPGCLLAEATNVPFRDSLNRELLQFVSHIDTLGGLVGDYGRYLVFVKPVYKFPSSYSYSLVILVFSTWK